MGTGSSSLASGAVSARSNAVFVPKMRISLVETSTGSTNSLTYADRHAGAPVRRAAAIRLPNWLIISSLILSFDEANWASIRRNAPFSVVR